MIMRRNNFAIKVLMRLVDVNIFFVDHLSSEALDKTTPEQHML